MATADRFAGPLAAAWPGAGSELLARVLVPPDASLPVPPTRERAVWAHPHSATTRHLRVQAEIAALDGAGHVASSWRPAPAPCASMARVPAAPMLAGMWGERLARLAIDVTVLGPTCAAVLVVEEIHPHEAFLGGTR